MIRNPYAKAPPRNPNAAAASSPAVKRPSHTAAASPAAKPNPYAKAPPRSPNTSNTPAASPAVTKRTSPTVATSPAAKPNPYAKAPPRSPNASNTPAASPAAKRARPCSVVVENGNESSASALFAGIADSAAQRLAQPPTSHIVPGQRRLFEHNNFAHHGSSRPSAYGGGGGNSNSNNNNSSNPGMDDDGGIDWDAALLQLDATVVTHSSSSSSSKKTSATGSGHSIDLTASPPPRTNNCNKTQSPNVALTAAGLVEAKPPLYSKAGAVSSPSLASLQPPAMLERPTAWTTGAATSGSPASATSNTASSVTVDPRQATLPQVLQFDPDKVKPVNDPNRALLVQHANLSAPLLNGWTLFSHQKKAILRGLLMRRMILALDMGLGKTLIGCVWARAFQKTFDSVKVIVICPVSLKKEWKRTAEEATGLKVQADDTKKENGCNDSTDVYIASWGKIPTPMSMSNKFVVVCDEAHSMQSMQAARTKDTLKLINSKSCLGVILLTGTPMKNGKPSNLFPLLKAVRHPFGNHQRAYETHFCAGRDNQFGNGRVVWNASGSSNLPQLRTLVASHLLHLTKEDCLKDLPGQTRVVKHVPVSSRCQLQFNKVLGDLAKVYNARSSMENGNDAVLGAVQKVRMVGSLAKIDATVELAKSILSAEPALVIFTSFVQVAQTLHKKLSESGWKGELLTGETPAKKRQDLVDNFQNGLSPVFVCTFGAGGVGLTLTAACTVILLDRPWTPGDAHQAEDRVRRIGQTKAVRSIWMSAFDLDRQIDSMLETKSQTANAVLVEGADSQPQYSDAPKLSIFQMLKTILPEKGDGGQQQSILPFSQNTSQAM